ncbi:surface protein [Frog virus 3]|uniref:Surface protein n=1 Tax=Frog virus 3 TaxID=10493 RepID=A0A5B8P0W9_FRG3V|nr:surface protein [Frog virus 3]
MRLWSGPVDVDGPPDVLRGSQVPGGPAVHVEVARGYLRPVDRSHGDPVRGLKGLEVCAPSPVFSHNVRSVKFFLYHQRWTPGSPPTRAHGHVSYVAQCATAQCREAVGRTYPGVVKKGLGLHLDGPHGPPHPVLHPPRLRVDPVCPQDVPPLCPGHFTSHVQ